MQAMILAAGFGTRLLPHTLVRPKPLFPILNTPLLQLTICRLHHCGCDHILVNCHHLGEQIVRAVGGMDGVTVIEETEILGTGGGLRNALQFMRDEPVLVTNGDIYHTIDLAWLYRQHLACDAPVTLAMHDYPRFNTVRVEGDRVAAFQRGEGGELLAFTGLHVIDPAIIEAIEPHRQSCIIERYRKMLQKKMWLHTVRVDDAFWTDMGTPEDYLALHGGLLQGTIPAWQEMGWDGSAEQIDPEAVLSGDLTVNDWCSVGKVCGQDVTLQRVVIWDGVQLLQGGRYSDMLISTDCR